MKAKYVKPQLCVEYFSLTQSVATACGWNAQEFDTLGKPTHGDPLTCTWDWNGIEIFTEQSACSGVQIDESTEYLGMCYNAPEGGQQIFAS